MDIYPIYKLHYHMYTGNLAVAIVTTNVYRKPIGHKCYTYDWQTTYTHAQYIHQGGFACIQTYCLTSLCM